jgi:hypothetical protein
MQTLLDHGQRASHLAVRRTRCSTRHDSNRCGKLVIHSVRQFLNKQPFFPVVQFGRSRLTHNILLSFICKWLLDDLGTEYLGQPRYGTKSASNNSVTIVVCGAIFSSLMVYSSKRFDRQHEDVADAALRLDCAWGTRIDLQFTPQLQDLDIDAPIEDMFVDRGGLQQVLA